MVPRNHFVIPSRTVSEAIRSGAFFISSELRINTIFEAKDVTEMEFMTGTQQKTLSAADLKGGSFLNQTVCVHGAVHAIRAMGAIEFVTLRLRDGALQCVVDEAHEQLLEGVSQECAVVATGTLTADERAPMGVELHLEKLEVLSSPKEPISVPVSKGRLKLNLDTELPLRPVALRNLRKRAVFKIQEAVGRAFRDEMLAQGCTEIHTPKIVHAGAEGGSNIFRMEYFGKKAYLTQSPQFYKQMMVGVFERVFEVAPVFRAEKHNTTRHLNEYISMDMEMGYIDSFTDLMQAETAFLQRMVHLLETEYADDLKRLGVELPRVDEIPTVRFDEAKRLVSEAYDPSATPTTWSRRRSTTSAAISRRSAVQISSLSPTTPPRSAPSTPWMTRRIRSTPCPSTCCSAALRSPPAASASTTMTNRCRKCWIGGCIRRSLRAIS